MEWSLLFALRMGVSLGRGSPWLKFLWLYYQSMAVSVAVVKVHSLAVISMRTRPGCKLESGGEESASAYVHPPRSPVPFWAALLGGEIYSCSTLLSL